MNDRHTLHLALQGGGAHGAFTWGALDRLLDEPTIDIGRISGTSAGALNAAALATGMVHGGRDGARRNLALLWQKAAEAGTLATLMMLPLRKPSLGLWDDSMPLLPPALANPMGILPLRQVLEQVIDQDALRSPDAPRVYVNAVRVRDGATRLFGPAELSIDALLASACAPQLFSGVEIEGEVYWDGSYTANPVMVPLYRGLEQADVLLVELSPLHRVETPVSAKNILNRINEIASTAGLVAELGRLHVYRQAHPAVRMHLLSMPDSAVPALLDASIKRSADMVLFQALRQEGWRCCDQWLRQNRSAVGHASTVDLEARYLRPYAVMADGWPASYGILESADVAVGSGRPELPR